MSDELRNPIGDRIRELRGRIMTQQDLATAADVSVDVIRKLEQGRRQTASIATLHRIAHVLDIDLGGLLGRQAMPETGPDAGVVQLRNAVADVSDLLDGGDDEPYSLTDAERAVTYLWGSYWSGRYDALTGLIPPALSSIRATLRTANLDSRVRAADALARVYWASGCTLAHLRQPDAAFLAIRQAVDLANHADDALLSATLRGSLSWQLLVQGRFSEAEQVASRTAQDIEPDGDASLPHLSTYGSLILTGATAAARDQNLPQARALLDASRVVAGRLPADRNDYQTPFGPSQVTMQSVDVAVVAENYEFALTTARDMSPTPGLPLAARARHQVDRAFAHVRLGQDDQALTLLLATEGMAPDWINHQTLVKYVVRELLGHEQRKTTRLRDLASRLGVGRM